MTDPTHDNGAVKPDKAAELIELAHLAMEQSGGSVVVYLHRDGEKAAEFAIVKVEWIAKLMRSQSDAIGILVDAPDTSHHDHIEPGMWEDAES